MRIAVLGAVTGLAEDLGFEVVDAGKPDRGPLPGAPHAALGPSRHRPEAWQEHRLQTRPTLRELVSIRDGWARKPMCVATGEDAACQTR